MSAEPASLYSLVRRLGVSDLDRVMEIELEVYPYPWTRGIFTDCIRVGYDCWGLQAGDKLIGYCIQTHAAGENHLLNLCLDSEWQRQGFGSLLLGHAIRQARLQDCDFMFLEVRLSNLAGMQLYEKNGFIIFGERPDYYRSEEGKESATIMRLDLSAGN
jgi:ribosomal-protein-alanine N-acetyltransferase